MHRSRSVDPVFSAGNIIILFSFFVNRFLCQNRSKDIFKHVDQRARCHSIPNKQIKNLPRTPFVPCDIISCFFIGISALYRGHRNRKNRPESSLPTEFPKRVSKRIPLRFSGFLSAASMAAGMILLFSQLFHRPFFPKRGFDL